MKSKLIFFFLFIQCSFISAQTISINSVEVCAGQEVLIPAFAGNQTPFSFDNNHYQSIVKSQTHHECSGPYALINNISALTGNSKCTSYKNISITYVPLSNVKAIGQAISGNGIALIQAMISWGQFSSENNPPERTQGLHYIFLDTSDRNPGVYFAELTLTLKNNTSHQIV